MENWLKLTVFSPKMSQKALNRAPSGRLIIGTAHPYYHEFILSHQDTKTPQQKNEFLNSSNLIIFNISFCGEDVMLPTSQNFAFCLFKLKTLTKKVKPRVFVNKMVQINFLKNSRTFGSAGKYRIHFKHTVFLCKKIG